jgi:hypothetical protein
MTSLYELLVLPPDCLSSLSVLTTTPLFHSHVNRSQTAISMSAFSAAPPVNPSLEQLSTEAVALTAEGRHEQA